MITGWRIIRGGRGAGWSFAAGTVLALLLPIGAGAEAKATVSLVEVAVAAHDMPRLEASLTIEAPIDEVWALVSDCTRFGDFMSDIDSARLLWRRKEKTRCRLVVDVPFPFGSLENVSDAVAERQPGLYRQSWKLVTGDFHYDEGFWELRSTAHGHTLVRYVSLVEPKLPVPRGLLLSGQKDYVLDMLQRLRQTAIRAARPR